MKNEEQKSAFILRVEEMAKELISLVNDEEGGGNERSCILLVNENPKGSDTTAQCVAILGNGKGFVKSMAALIEQPDMAEAVALGAKIASLKKIIEN